MSAPVAALDLGTNTILLLVARGTALGALEVLDDQCRMPRLGEGLAASAALSPAAIERGLAVLAEFRERALRLGVAPSDVRAVGTAALRRARNAREFIELARARTGFAIEVLSEEDEARLGYLAALADGAAPDTCIVDVGGGSTEVVADGGRLRLSAPIGAVVLTERGQGSLAGAAWDERAWSELRDEVRRACERFPAAGSGACAGAVIVLGGSGANLAALELAQAQFSPAATEGAQIVAARAAEWSERLRRLALAQRLKFPIEVERAAILPAGLACLAGALERLGVRQVGISGRGLRYGVVRELLQAARPGARPQQVG